jgi:hypothetical protein
MTNTLNLELPYIEGGQAQKHVTHNEALRRLDTSVQIAVRDATHTAPPLSPAEGDRYIVATGASGAWAGHVLQIAAFVDGAWEFLEPKAGWRVWSLADDRLLVFDGATWRDAANYSAVAPVDALAFNGLQVNGAMEVSQENGASAVTLTATGTLQFRHLLDGVVAGYRGSFVASAQQVAAPTGMPAKNAQRVSVTTAQASLGTNDELTLMLPVEGVRASRLLFGTSHAAPLSLGFWFCAHRPGTYSGAIMNSAKTRCYPFSFVVAAADTPQWILLGGANAILGDSSGAWLNDAGVGLYLCICLAAGTARTGASGAWATTSSPGTVGVSGTTNGVAAVSDVFHVSSIILLPGIALPSGERAPLIMRPFAQELAICQRYYHRQAGALVSYFAQGYAYAATGALCVAPYPVRMRAVPTMSFTAPSTFMFYIAGSNVATSIVQHISTTVDIAAFQVDGSWSLSGGQAGWLLDAGGANSIIDHSARLV